MGWTQNTSLCTPRPVPTRSAHFSTSFDPYEPLGPLQVNHYVRAIPLQQCALAGVEWEMLANRLDGVARPRRGLGCSRSAASKHDDFRAAISARLYGTATAELNDDETAAVGIGLRKLFDRSILARPGSAVPLTRIPPPARP